MPCPQSWLRSVHCLCGCLVRSCLTTTSTTPLTSLDCSLASLADSCKQADFIHSKFVRHCCFATLELHFAGGSDACSVGRCNVAVVCPCAQVRPLELPRVSKPEAGPSGARHCWQGSDHGRRRETRQQRVAWPPPCSTHTHMDACGHAFLKPPSPPQSPTFTLFD